MMHQKLGRHFRETRDNSIEFIRTRMRGLLFLHDLDSRAMER